MKGISPLLASILLIAFTLAVAVIIGSWLTSMSSQQASTVGGSANETITCSKGLLGFVSISNNTAVIQNQGTIDLSGNFSFSCGTNVTTNSSITLRKGSITTLIETSGGCTGSGVKIRVSSYICPNVYVECTYGSNCP